ncbi:MAG: sigma-70 family RNA polymerase sigma factor, partial [Faecalibacterium prausnitzii]
MEVTIHYNGQAVAVEVTLEVYEFLDRADHKTENLSHEQRRHWDGREFD